MAGTIIDKAGLRPARRVPPAELTVESDGQACLYNEIRRYDEAGEDLPPRPSVDVLWMCPSPDMGAAVIVVNFRFRFQQKWLRLIYSLKESALRSVEQCTCVYADASVCGCV